MAYRASSGIPAQFCPPAPCRARASSSFARATRLPNGSRLHCFCAYSVCLARMGWVARLQARGERKKERERESVCVCEREEHRDASVLLLPAPLAKASMWLVPRTRKTPAPQRTTQALCLLTDSVSEALAFPPFAKAPKSISALFSASQPQSSEALRIPVQMQSEYSVHATVIVLFGSAQSQCVHGGSDPRRTPPLAAIGGHDTSAPRLALTFQTFAGLSSTIAGPRRAAALVRSMPINLPYLPLLRTVPCICTFTTARGADRIVGQWRIESLVGSSMHAYLLR